MKALGDYVHGKGLKFGIYQAPLDKTCAQYFSPTPADRQPQPRGPGRPPVRRLGRRLPQVRLVLAHRHHNDQVTRFAKMRDALAATGRPILYSINPNSIHGRPARGNWGDVANIWRTTEDITNAWDTGRPTATDGHPEHRQRQRPLAVVRQARRSSTTPT